MAITVDSEAPTVPEDAPLRRTANPVTTLTRTAIPLTMFAVALVAMVRTAAAPLSNPDTFFHLRFGHEFLDNWSLAPAT